MSYFCSLLVDILLNLWYNYSTVLTIFQEVRAIIITVDRIEEDYAVCIAQNEAEFSLPISVFDKEIKEKDVFELTFLERQDLKMKNENKIKNIFDRLKNRD